MASAAPEASSRGIPEERRDERRQQGVEAGLDGQLQRRAEPASVRHAVQPRQHDGGLDQRHTECVDEQIGQIPAEGSRCPQADGEVPQAGQQHDPEARDQAAAGRPAQGEPAGQVGTAHHAGGRRAEQPDELGFLQAQMAAQEYRGGKHVDEEAGEHQGEGHCPEHEGQVAQHVPIARQQGACGERLAPVGWQCFRKTEQHHGEQRHPHRAEQGEVRTPARMHLQPAAQNRADGGGQGEQHDHQCIETLRGDAGIQVAYHRSADHDAGSGGQPLQYSADIYLLDTGGAGGADGCQGEYQQAGDHHWPPPQAVGESAMPERHEGECGEIQGQGDLQLDVRDAEHPLHLLEGGHVDVDGEGAEHRQAGEQDRQESCRGG